MWYKQSKIPHLIKSLSAYVLKRNTRTIHHYTHVILCIVPNTEH